MVEARTEASQLVVTVVLSQPHPAQQVEVVQLGIMVGVAVPAQPTVPRVAVGVAVQTIHCREQAEYQTLRAAAVILETRQILLETELATVAMVQQPTNQEQVVTTVSSALLMEVVVPQHPLR